MNDLQTSTLEDRSIGDGRATAPALLDHLALLIAHGRDARTFLDSQLTRNVPLAGAPASMAGYCSPKGRLLASIVIWADANAAADGAIGMLVSHDIAAAIAKRLRMYVLRAKVTIDDVTSTHAIEGWVDPEAHTALEPWAVLRDEGRTWIRYPDADGRRRLLRLGPRDATRDVAADAGPVDASTWRWLEIRAGLARVTTATQDRFVPQMLNLEALGGVDFKKGCFPGQEIVARSQYLGKLKRRMTVASLAAATVPAAATDVWMSGAAEPCGLVVNAERGPDGRVALLVELPVSAFASRDLRIGTGDGDPLAIEALPYVLPDNEVFVRPKL